MKADKHEIQMRCWDEWEFYEAVDELVAVEFGNVDNLGDNQFRYESIYS